VIQSFADVTTADLWAERNSKAARRIPRAGPPSVPVCPPDALSVHPSSNRESELALVAERRGVSIEMLVREASERMADHAEWFILDAEVGF